MHIRTADEIIGASPVVSTPESNSYRPDLYSAATPEPAPKVSLEPAILPLVMQDLVARAEVGLKTYKTLLKPNNGRDALMDAYQESLDLCMYLRQAIAEREINAK